MSELKNLSKIRDFRVLSTLKKYKTFMQYGTPSEGLDKSFKEAPILIISYLYSDSILASYIVIDRIIKKPINTYMSTLSLLFKKILVEKFQIMKKMYSIIRLSVSFAILISLGYLVTAQYLIDKFFEGKYQYLYEIGLFLLVIYIFQMIVSPITYIFTVQMKQKMNLSIHLIFSMMLLMTFLLSWFMSYDFYWFIAIYTAMMCLMYCVYCAVSFHYLKEYHNEIEKENGSLSI